MHSIKDNAAPQSPREQCNKTDCLACKGYNMSAWAALSEDNLAILLAAVRKSAGTGDQNTKDLVDGALSALTQMTRDIGSAISYFSSQAGLVSPDCPPRGCQEGACKYANLAWECVPP